LQIDVVQVFLDYPGGKENYQQHLQKHNCLSETWNRPSPAKISILGHITNP